MYEIDARALDRRAPRLGGGDGEDGGGGAGDLLLKPGVFYQAADLDHQQASLRVAGHPSLCLILSSSTACSRHMTQMCVFGLTSCPFAKFASDWLVGSPHCIFLDFLYMLAPSSVFQHRYIMRRRMLPCTPVRLASESGLPRARRCSFSVVDHLRWDLRAIFRLAAQDRLLSSNPAEMLFTPPTLATPSRRVLTPEQVQQILLVLPVREQLIVRLALFSGMRPGEIFALQWKHIAGDHVEVVHRIYRGKLDRPKSERSKRTVALSSTPQSLITQWRQQSRSCDPDAWVFPSAKLTTPLGRDNAWRGLIAPRLKTVQLEWATFQIMRRTHASLSRQAGIDPKLVADQLGHGLGVNLDVYTVAALHKRQDAVEMLESALARRGSD